MTEVNKVLGVTGLSIWKGILSEEYLPALRGTKKVKVFREMADDAVIGALLDSIRMPLVAAEFSVTPASDSAADKKAAEFLESCLFDMTRYSWRQHLLDMLDMLTYGWALSEIVLKKRLGDAADPPSKFDDGRLGIDILDPRGQETLDYWNMDEENNVDSMVQRDPVTGEKKEIPDWKMVHVTFRSRKRSPEGNSPLRSLYRSWYMRKNLEVIEAIGVERDMAGLPVMTLPPGATDTDKLEAEAIVRNIRQDEEAGVVLPAPPIGSTEGWKLELLSGGGKMYNAREIIRDLNKIILMRFFAQFLLIGMEQVGTQALVKGSQDFFSLGLKSIQQELLEMWNQQLVPVLFKFNKFSGMTGQPYLDWADPGKFDIKALADLINSLTGSQIITPGPELEDHIRDIAGLPDRPEGVGEGPRQPITPIDIPFVLRRRYRALSPKEWEDAYEKGIPHWAVDMSPSLFAQEFVDKLREEGYATVLEIGCGNGRDSILFARAGLVATAIDVAPGAVELAKSNAAEAGVQIDIRLANAESLPFTDKSFDAIFSLSVLHSTNVERSLSEAVRVLRPGGLMFLYLYSDTGYISGKRDEYLNLDGFISLLRFNNIKLLDLYCEQEDEYDEFGERHAVIVCLTRYGGS